MLLAGTQIEGPLKKRGSCPPPPTQRLSLSGGRGARTTKCSDPNVYIFFTVTIKKSKKKKKSAYFIGTAVKSRK